MFQSDYVVYATLFPILDYGYYATRLIPVQHFGIAYTYEKREFEGVYIGINDISFRYHENYLITIGADQKMGHAEGAYQELDKRVKAKFRVKEQLIRWSAQIRTVVICYLILALPPRFKTVICCYRFSSLGHNSCYGRLQNHY